MHRLIALSALAGLAMSTPAFANSPAAPPVAQADGQAVSEAALKAAATDGQVRAFYERVGWRSVWSTSAAQALDEALARRDRHGLERVPFLKVADGADAAAQEIARTEAALRYAEGLARGVADPAALHSIYTLDRPDPDLVAGLAQAMSGGDVGRWLESLAPQDAEYQQLSAAYLRYRGEAGTGQEAIAPAGLVRQGDRGPAVQAIVAQLVDSGYLDPPIEADGRERYSQAVADAVRALQRDYGIAADGVVGPDTLSVLNLGPGDRARALAVALERRRWLARDPAGTRIDVNTAAARLRYYRDGTEVDSRKVIVGAAGKETPALASPIYRLVANPTWTVPKSIQNGELAQVGADYLRSHNMVMRDGWIVQQPGPDNALGLVKFDMRNRHAIYLHDTSAPALFERSQRQLSHGCVRVEDALGFAERIAEDEGVIEQWQAAQASGEQRFVPLPREIPVRLLYHNVFIDGAGQVAFRTDPYGWNAAVADALGYGGGSRRAANAQAGDIGP